MAIQPEFLAADGDDVDPGIEPPDDLELIAYLRDNGWPMPDQEGTLEDLKATKTTGSPVWIEAEATEDAGGHDAT